MRQRQFLIIAYRVTVQQQVEVDRARAEALLADAAEPALHVKQHMEQCPRIKVRLQFRRGVEIGTLTRRTTDRLRFVVGGHRCHANVCLIAQQLQCFIEKPAPVAEIAAQGDVRRRWHGSLRNRTRIKRIRSVKIRLIRLIRVLF